MIAMRWPQPDARTVGQPQTPPSTGNGVIELLICLSLRVPQRLRYFRPVVWQRFIDMTPHEPARGWCSRSEETQGRDIGEELGDYCEKAETSSARHRKTS